MEHIWPVVVEFGCFLVFSLFLLRLNEKTTGSAPSRRFTWYTLWIFIFFMLVTLAHVAIRVSEVHS